MAVNIYIKLEPCAGGRRLHNDVVAQIYFKLLIASLNG